METGVVDGCDDGDSVIVDGIAVGVAVVMIGSLQIVFEVSHVKESLANLQESI